MTPQEVAMHITVAIVQRYASPPTPYQTVKDAIPGEAEAVAQAYKTIYQAVLDATYLRHSGEAD